MKRIIPFLFFSLAFSTLSAQTFTGSVFYKRANGSTEPLPFAQIYHLEEKKLLEADENGKFSVNLDADATLIATYVGYTKDTLTVSPGTTEGSFFLSGENDISEAVVTGKQDGISKLKSIKTEVISSAGLCKMACCAVAESFENSASVTVGFSDAITGARQIKLLGLSGTYTQMLDENRPVMRALASPFGLQYVPGQWLEGIQIAKGPSSVTNGLEAITGQINMEHRKPTDETPLFIQLYGSSDRMFEANAASAIQINDRWNVVNLAHIGGTSSKMDHNCDGFRDEPEDFQVNVASRWLYYHPSGLQVRFGLSYVNDDRLGGQNGFTRNQDHRTSTFWGSNILNRGFDAYTKVGIPLNEDQSASLGIISDFSHYASDAFFGRNDYYGEQNLSFFNVIYQNSIDEVNKIVAGTTFHADYINEHYMEHIDSAVNGNIMYREENGLSLFTEYTFTPSDRFTLVGGVNLEWNSLHGWLFAPRLNLMYSLTDNIVLRALGGRGYRTANIISDNLGILSTGKRLVGSNTVDTLEDAWTYGGNVTFYLPFGAGEGNTYLSLDYFRNDFIDQVIVDQEAVSEGAFKYGNVECYNLDGKSCSNTFQADFNVEPVERLTFALTFRYTDAKVTLKDWGMVERPMSSRFKGVFNTQYSTPMNIWTFDFTAQLNGPMRLPVFAAEAWGMEYSPVYPMLYAQVTRKFKGFDVYVGGENLTNFRQKEAILGADNPFGAQFNASCIWGPLMGTKVYAGIRYTLWK